MKKIIIYILLFLPLIGIANTFEGVISMQIALENETQNVDFYIKDSKVKMQINGVKNKESYSIEVLSIDEKLYTIYNGETFEISIDKVLDINSVFNVVYNAEESETNKISGFKTKSYAALTDNGNATIEVLENYTISSMPKLFLQQGVVKALLSYGILNFPLNIEMEGYSQKVTSIEKKKLDDSFFAVK